MMTPRSRVQMCPFSSLSKRLKACCKSVGLIEVTGRGHKGVLVGRKRPAVGGEGARDWGEGARDWGEGARDWGEGATD